MLEAFAVLAPLILKIDPVGVDTYRTSLAVLSCRCRLNPEPPPPPPPQAETPTSSTMTNQRPTRLAADMALPPVIFTACDAFGAGSNLFEPLTPVNVRCAPEQT